ncbi:hypothetical protein G9A89_001809 [Geosiphon pyriformis]|nr:hypothetical protein G9A89_001809 [Geosiphon pyriformis]
MNHRSLGNDAIKRRDYETALIEYNKGITISPKDPALWCNRAYVYLKQGFPELAVMDAIRVSNLIRETDGALSNQNFQILGFKAAYRQGEAYIALELYQWAQKKFRGLLKFQRFNSLSIPIDRKDLLAKEDLCHREEKKLVKHKYYKEYEGNNGKFTFSVTYPWDPRSSNRRGRYTLEGLQENVRAITLKALKVDLANFNKKLAASSHKNCDDSETFPSNKSQVQFGIFSVARIEEGEVIFQEDPFLCVNNHFTPRCDYCNRPLSEMKERFPCINEDCNESYCNEECFGLAFQRYHKSLCGRDLNPILLVTQTGSSTIGLLYLLVLKVFSVANMRGINPLDIPEIVYLARYERLGKKGLDFNPYWPTIYEKILSVLNISSYDLKFDFWIFITCLSTLGCNSFANKDEHGRPDTACLLPQASLINHNCEPNTHHTNVPKSDIWSRQVFTAAKIIQAGEQLMISYVDSKLSKKERLFGLAFYGFECDCPKCEREPK